MLHGGSADGGGAPHGADLINSWIFDIQSLSWTKKKTCTEEFLQQHHTSVQGNNCVMILGGIRENNQYGGPYLCTGCITYQNVA